MSRRRRRTQRDMTVGHTAEGSARARAPTIAAAHAQTTTSTAIPVEPGHRRLRRKALTQAAASTMQHPAPVAVEQGCVSGRQPGSRRHRRPRRSPAPSRGSSRAARRRDPRQHAGAGCDVGRHGSVVWSTSPECLAAGRARPARRPPTSAARPPTRRAGRQSRTLPKSRGWSDDQRYPAAAPGCSIEFTSVACTASEPMP